MANLTRHTLLDSLRGILMLYIVVVIHGLFWLGFQPQWIFSALLFEMPALFMISGYSYALWERQQAGRSLSKHPVPRYLLFLASRWIRILIPYLVYALTCALIVTLARSPESTQEVLRIWFAWLNPFAYGRSFSIAALNWHLWFIPVFLLVTTLLPLITKIAHVTDYTVGVMAVALLGIQIVLGVMDFPGAQLFRETFFYLIFTLAGYRLAKLGKVVAERHLLTAAMASAILLLTAFFYTHNFDVFDMQKNKFPPNYRFFLFSVFWMSLFMLIGKRYAGLMGSVARLADSRYLRPFVSAGYSIYLWQGLGYTIAIWMGKRVGLPTFGIVVCALLVSVVCGLATSSAERIRFRSGTRNEPAAEKYGAMALQDASAFDDLSTNAGNQRAGFKEAPRIGLS
jgi:peptidoglycan/LPS O-acetylase OafA/YrhL